MKKIWSAVYNGFIWACLCTLLCARSVVICMKVNIGVLFFVAFILFSVLAAVLCFAGKKDLGAKFSLGNLCICGLIVFVVYRFVYHQELWGKPAFIVRLAFHCQTVSPELVNGALAAAVIVGYICVLAVGRCGRRQD